MFIEFADTLFTFFNTHIKHQSQFCLCTGSAENANLLISGTFFRKTPKIIYLSHNLHHTLQGQLLHLTNSQLCQAASPASHPTKPSFSVSLPLVAARRFISPHPANVWLQKSHAEHQIRHLKVNESFLYQCMFASSLVQYKGRSFNWIS